MRVLKKPSTACCNQSMYITYLLSDPHYTSFTRLSEIMKTVSHDSINRFLERERYEPKDLFDEEKEKIELIGGMLGVDDSVLDKPYSDSTKAAFIDFFWSGKHKRTVIKSQKQEKRSKRLMIKLIRFQNKFHENRGGIFMCLQSLREAIRNYIEFYN